MADKRLADLRRRLAERRKQHRFVARRIAKLKAAISTRRKQLASQNVGERAVAHAAKSMGAHEDAGRPNRSKWLDGWVKSFGQRWMLGQAYCGLGCWIWWKRAGKKLPLDTVSTVAIANRAHSGNGFKAVRFEDAKPGDLAVMHFGTGGPKHVGLVRARPVGGQVKTYEANTSPTNGGSQSNGGGCYPRSRSRGLIHTIARPI